MKAGVRRSDSATSPVAGLGLRILAPETGRGSIQPARQNLAPGSLGCRLQSRQVSLPEPHPVSRPGSLSRMESLYEPVFSLRPKPLAGSSSFIPIARH